MDVNSVMINDMPMSAPIPQPAAKPVTDVQPVAAKNEPPQKTHTTEPSKYSMDDLSRAMNQINKSIAAFSRHMDISVHQKTNRIMVKVMDTEKNEVIREIPPEKVLDAFARALELAGILIDKRS